MNVILDAVEAGHHGSGLGEAGQEKPGSVCKKDGEPWPCAAIRVARKKHKAKMDGQ